MKAMLKNKVPSRSRLHPQTPGPLPSECDCRPIHEIPCCSVCVLRTLGGRRGALDCCCSQSALPHQAWLVKQKLTSCFYSEPLLSSLQGSRVSCSGGLAPFITILQQILHSYMRAHVRECVCVPVCVLPHQPRAPAAPCRTSRRC